MFTLTLKFEIDSLLLYKVAEYMGMFIKNISIDKWTNNKIVYLHFYQIRQFGG